MPQFILSGLKFLGLYLAQKYAAELVIKHTLNKLEELAKRTDNQIDDDMVAVLKAEQTVIVKAISGKL